VSVVLAPLLAAAAVLLGAAAGAPPPVRIQRLATKRRRAAAPRRVGLAAAADRLLSGMGCRLRAAAGRPPHPALDRRWGVAGLSVFVASVSPALAVLMAAALLSVPAVVARREERRTTAAIRSALPDAVDLVRLGIDAGLTPSLALAEAAPRIPPPLGPELEQALNETTSGRPLAEALGDVAHDLGEPVRPLTTALVATERDGAPLAPTLERLALEVRRDRRRRAEEAARRLPVKLLFPLVLCTLPAFALLTLVPLVAGVLSSLRL